MANIDTPKQIDFSKSQIWLTSVWGFGFSLIALLIIVQSTAGKYENKMSEAWGWFISLVLPNLSLMLTILFAQPKNEQSAKITVPVFYYRIAVAFSLGYLSIILIVILGAPLTTKSTIELMNDSKIFLATFQTLLSIILGLFFIKK